MAEVALTAREEKKKEFIWCVLANNGAEVVLFLIYNAMLSYTQTDSSQFPSSCDIRLNVCNWST